MRNNKLIGKPISKQQLQSICTVLADTNRDLAKTELTHTLQHCRIAAIDDGKRNIGNGIYYQLGLNKRELVIELAQQHKLLNLLHGFPRNLSYVL